MAPKRAAETSTTDTTLAFPALVNEKDLLHGLGPTWKDRLPVRRVELPVKNVSEYAVLSWRWDGDLSASAVRQAKIMGARYLFVDVISVKQNLPGDGVPKKFWRFQDHTSHCCLRQ